MSAPTPLRQDFDASQLRGLARKTKDGPQARRLLALAAIYDGATRTEAAKIGDVTAYRGAPLPEETLHFPGFGAEATEWLLRRRGIRALGVDTLSIDPGVSEEFETHLILLGADRYGLENLANLDRLPRRGSTVVVGLIPYEQGSGGQARVFASW